jgi:hypothetical protein
MARALRRRKSVMAYVIASSALDHPLVAMRAKSRGSGRAREI